MWLGAVGCGLGLCGCAKVCGPKGPQSGKFLGPQHVCRVGGFSGSLCVNVVCIVVSWWILYLFFENMDIQ